MLADRIINLLLSTDRLSLHALQIRCLIAETAYALFGNSFTVVHYFSTNLLLAYLPEDLFFPMKDGTESFSFLNDLLTFLEPYTLE